MSEANPESLIITFSSVLSAQRWNADSRPTSSSEQMVVNGSRHGKTLNNSSRIQRNVSPLVFETKIIPALAIFLSLVTAVRGMIVHSDDIGENVGSIARKSPSFTRVSSSFLLNVAIHLLTEGTTTPTVFRPGISMVALRAPLRRSVMSLTCSTFRWSF